MEFRTDLAVEAAEAKTDIKGIECSEEKVGKANISRMMITSKEASEKLGKPVGKYITVEVPALTDYFRSTDERIKVVAKEIKALIPNEGPILVAGLGNSAITPDALGPKSASKVLATRHISGELAKSIGLQDLRSVTVLAPGVLGQTGMEASEMLLSVTERLKPCCAIVADALASRRLSRLGCTIQISDSGICPGAGVGNSRPSINHSTLGIPVIGIGTPTVVDATTLAHDILGNNQTKNMEDTLEKVSPRGEMMIVTPREIDLLIDRASTLIAMAINCALHPSFSPDELYSLVS